LLPAFLLQRPGPLENSGIRGGTVCFGRQRPCLRATGFPRAPRGCTKTVSEGSVKGFFGRTGLLAPAILAPVAETALLRSVAPGNAALAAQVTAPPPLDLFHDLRWISVFHDSWLTLGLELGAVLLLRSLWIAWVVQRAWPKPDVPAMAPAARRASVFYALSMVLFVPWVILLFGLAFSHLSFLFFAAIPPALAIAAVMHRGAASRTAGLRLGSRP